MKSMKFANINFINGRTALSNQLEKAALISTNRLIYYLVIYMQIFFIISDKFKDCKHILLIVSTIVMSMNINFGCFV